MSHSISDTQSKEAVDSAHCVPVLVGCIANLLEAEDRRGELYLLVNIRTR